MNDWLLDHPDILHVVFHPRSAYSATSESPDARIVTIPVAPDVAVGGKLYPADYQSPLILYFHGNGEIADDYDDLAPLYNRIGITLLVVDYRGYGISQGTPSASTLLTDAVAVFEALPALCEDEQLAPLRTYVMGRSLGSVPRHRDRPASGRTSNGVDC
ncbi:MAG: alpha/beta hydrolase [Chloroflexaceae bacterium]|nr:alpha/beta hydrolase [Chloroflexaceae bacterium]